MERSHKEYKQDMKELEDYIKEMQQARNMYLRGNTPQDVRDARECGRIIVRLKREQTLLRSARV